MFVLGDIWRGVGTQSPELTHEKDPKKHVFPKSYRDFLKTFFLKNSLECMWFFENPVSISGFFERYQAVSQEENLFFDLTLLFINIFR